MRAHRHQTEVDNLVDSLFRRKAGQLISTLTRIFGADNIELAESVVQEAFLKACQTWPYHGIPDNPSAWLTTVAKNHTLNIIKKAQKLIEKETEIVEWYQTVTESENIDYEFDNPISLDDQLRMIFLCCNPILSQKMPKRDFWKRSWLHESGKMTGDLNMSHFDHSDCRIV